MRKKLLVIVAALALALSMPAMAFASNSAFDKGATDSSSYVDTYTGNAFLVGRDALNMVVESDLYWAGETLNASGLDIGKDAGGSALLAGQTLNVASSSIAGSLRAAGQNVSVSGTAVGNNITIAGQDVSLSSDVSARGVYVAGSEVSVSGAYQGAAIAAGTVNLSGSYAGDVRVSAGTVTVAKGTTIGGTLTVPSDANLVVEEGASVANTEYAAASAAVSSADQAASPLMMVGPLLFSCLAHVLLVLLFFSLFKGAMERATELTKTKLAPMFLYGLAAFFVLPLLAVLLLFPLVTAPISALIVIFIAVLWLFSIPFAGYMLGRRLFKNMKPLGAGVLGTLILTAVCYVPFLFFVVPTVSSVFVAGYLIQGFIDNRAAQKEQPNPLPETPAE